MTTFQNVTPLFPQVVIDNLYEIASLKAGEKLLCFSKEGRIQKENRWFLVSARRGYYGAFDLEVVKNTFNSAIELMCDSKESGSLERLNFSKDPECKTLDDLFQKALKGLTVLHQTYQQENKERGLHSLIDGLSDYHPLMQSSLKGDSDRELLRIDSNDACHMDCPQNRDEVAQEGRVNPNTQTLTEDKSECPDSSFTQVEDLGDCMAGTAIAHPEESQTISIENTSLQHDDEQSSLPESIAKDLAEFVEVTEEAFHTAIDQASKVMKAISGWFSEIVDEESDE
jgi:hypothetical protein